MQDNIGLHDKACFISTFILITAFVTKNFILEIICILMVKHISMSHLRLLDMSMCREGERPDFFFWASHFVYSFFQRFHIEIESGYRHQVMLSFVVTVFSVIRCFDTSQCCLDNEIPIYQYSNRNIRNEYRA